MSENLLNTIQALKIVYLAGFVWLYGAGGISGKWKRRIVGSFILTLGISLFSLWVGSFSYWYLACFALWLATLSIGYGSEGKGNLFKVYKRGRYGIAVACAAIPIAIITQQWILFALHIGLVTVTSVILGVTNPFKGEAGARKEESTIAAVSGLLPLMMV